MGLFYKNNTILVKNIFFIKVVKPNSDIIHAELHWMGQTELHLGLCISADIMKTILWVGQCMWRSHWNALAGEGREPWFHEEDEDKSNVFCRRRCENKSFAGMVPRRRWGREQGCRQRRDVLQSVPNSMRVPWRYKGVPQQPEQLLQPLLPARLFNARLFYIGISTSSFHTTYIPIRLGSSFTCIHTVSRWHG